MPEISLHEALRTSRAVRRLKPDPIPPDVLRRVFEAATWAPSGGNRQPWRIIAVRDPALKQQLAGLYREPWKAYITPMRDALPNMPEATRAIATRNIAAGDYLAEHMHEAPVIAVFCFESKLLYITDRKFDRASVVGGASIYPAVQNLLLACRAEGLGCVLTTILVSFEPQIKPLLGLPDGWGTAAFVPIGYPVGRGYGATLRRQPVETMVFGDKFGQSFF